MLPLETEKVPEKKVARRQFLAKVLKAGFLGIAGILGAKEVKTAISRYVQTTAGRFYPVYERHDKHAEVQDTIIFPQPCHGFFPEFVSSKTMDDLAVRIALDVGVAHDTQTPSVQLILTDQTLSKVIQEQIPLLYGDVHVPNLESSQWAETAVALRTTCAQYAELFLAVHLGSDLKDALLQKRPWHAPLSRRLFLKGSLATTAAVATAANERMSTQNWMMEGLNSENELVRRAYARVSGVISQLRPEYANEFFRNLVVANKLLLYGEHVQYQGFSQPNIVLQYHGGHSGIEDFLVLGREFCRTLIAQFPTEFLNQCYALNGDSTKFCSLRIIQLAHNFKYKRTLIQTDSLPRLVSGFKGDVSLDEKIVDTSLLNYLSERSSDNND